MRSSLVPDVNHRLERLLPEIYLVVALLLGTLYACITPPFFVADELSHAMRGAQVANGSLLGHVNPSGQGDSLDSGLSSTALYFYGFVGEIVKQPNRDRAVPRITQDQLSRARSAEWSHQPAFVAFPMTRIYPPTFYLPGAIGWRLGEAEKYTILHSLLLARLCSLLFATAIGWLAIRLGEGCRWSIAAILLIPALLSLDGSCSQDALIASSAALGVAVLSRALAERRLLLVWEIVLAGTALCAVGMTRPPYMLLLFSLIIPAIEVDWRSRRNLLLPLTVILLALVMDLSWYLAVRPLGFLVGPGANPLAQSAFLTHHPFQGAEYVLLGFLKDIPILISNIAEAGSGDVRAPVIVDLIVFLLVLGVLIKEEARLLERTSSRLLVLAICVVSSVGMAFAEYIIWTPPGAHFVGGLQIRHFIVLMPLFALVCGFMRSSRATWPQWFFLALIPLDFCLLLFDAHVFYGRDLFYALRITQF